MNNPFVSVLPPRQADFLFGDMMKKINLMGGQVALVDDDMFEYLSQWKWRANKKKNTFYVCSGRSVYMHR